MPKIVPVGLNRRYFLGIDIGKKGGLAAIDLYGSVIACEPFPQTPADIIQTIRDIDAVYPITQAVVEKIWAFPKTTKTTAFSMGYSLGIVEAALAVLGISYTLVAAVTWQKKFKLPSRPAGELDNTEHKERLRVIAQKMFPKLDLWKKKNALGEQRAVCDALLIADYCRRENVSG